MSKEAMKRFLIETPVENAEGSQTWYVDATSEAEALKKYEQGGCDLYASNVDVTSLGEPEISGETTLDNFGDFAEQPAQQQNGPINEGWQITVAHGHSGYGVYAHMEDYPEEGAVLVQAIEQPAKLEPVAWKWQQAPIRTAWGDDMAVASVAIDKDHTVDLYCEREQIAKVEVMFTSPPAQRKPLKLWTEAQHERAYRNSPELHKDVKSLAAFKRVAKEIAAMYGIKENT